VENEGDGDTGEKKSEILCQTSEALLQAFQEVGNMIFSSFLLCHVDAYKESSYSSCNGSDLGEKNAKDALCFSQKAPNQQKLVSFRPFFLCAICHWFSVI
jgi:hypothetical protein